MHYYRDHDDSRMLSPFTGVIIGFVVERLLFCGTVRHCACVARRTFISSPCEILLSAYGEAIQITTRVNTIPTVVNEWKG